MALRWSDLDSQEKTLTIERALEETKKHGVRFKGPKKESHKRTITIDDDLLALLLAERDKHLRMIAGVPDGVTVDLGLVKLPEGALMFPNPPALAELSFTTPRKERPVSKKFDARPASWGSSCGFHDLRGTHETLLLDPGVPVHVVPPLRPRSGDAAAQLRQANQEGRHECGERHWKHLQNNSGQMKIKLGPAWVQWTNCLRCVPFGIVLRL